MKSTLLDHPSKRKSNSFCYPCANLHFLFIQVVFTLLALAALLYLLFQSSVGYFETPVDLVFVLDGSGVVTEDLWALERSCVEKWSQVFRWKFTKLQISFIEFSQSATLSVPLTKNYTVAQETLGRMTRSKMAKNYEAALQQVNRTVSLSRQAKSFVLTVFLAAGPPAWNMQSDHTLSKLFETAQRLKDDHVTILGVYLGPRGMDDDPAQYLINVTSCDGVSKDCSWFRNFTTWELFNQSVENLALNTTFKLPDESMFIQREWSSLFLGFFLIGVLCIMFIMCWVFSLMNHSRDHGHEADSHMEELIREELTSRAYSLVNSANSPNAFLNLMQSEVVRISSGKMSVPQVNDYLLEMRPSLIHIYNNKVEKLISDFREIIKTEKEATVFFSMSLSECISQLHDLAERLAGSEHFAEIPTDEVRAIVQGFEPIYRNAYEKKKVDKIMQLERATQAAAFHRNDEAQSNMNMSDAIDLAILGNTMDDDFYKDISDQEFQDIKRSLLHKSMFREKNPLNTVKFRSPKRPYPLDDISPPQRSKRSVPRTSTKPGNRIGHHSPARPSNAHHSGSPLQIRFGEVKPDYTEELLEPTIFEGRYSSNHHWVADIRGSFVIFPDGETTKATVLQNTIIINFGIDGVLRGVLRSEGTRWIEWQNGTVWKAMPNNRRNQETFLRIAQAREAKENNAYFSKWSLQSIMHPAEFSILVDFLLEKEKMFLIDKAKEPLGFVSFIMLLYMIDSTLPHSSWNKIREILPGEMKGKQHFSQEEVFSVIEKIQPTHLGDIEAKLSERPFFSSSPRRKEKIFSNTYMDSDSYRTISPQDTFFNQSPSLQCGRSPQSLLFSTTI